MGLQHRQIFLASKLINQIKVNYLQPQLCSTVLPMEVMGHETMVRVICVIYNNTDKKKPKYSWHTYCNPFHEIIFNDYQYQSIPINIYSLIDIGHNTTVFLID